MINFEFKLYKDFIIEAYTLSSNDLEENIPLFGFDFTHLKGYNPLTSLKKGYYYNYLYIEFFILNEWKITLNIGTTYKTCDYNLALKEYKKRQKERYG